MSFSQVVTIPLVYPVYLREVMNNMYSPAPFFFAKLLVASLSFLAYPMTVSLTSIWLIGMPEVTWAEYWWFVLPLFYTAAIALVTGLTIGANFAHADVALNINTYVMMMFQFGGGLYVNASSAATWFVQVLSWVSPLKYSIELFLRRLLKHFPTDIQDNIYEELGYEFGVQTCVFMLSVFWVMMVILGLIGVWRLSKP